MSIIRYTASAEYLRSGTRSVPDPVGPQVTLVAKTGETFAVDPRVVAAGGDFCEKHMRSHDPETNTYHMNLTSTTLKYFIDHHPVRIARTVLIPWETSDVWEVLMKGYQTKQRPHRTGCSHNLRERARDTPTRSARPEHVNIHLRNFIYHHTLYTKEPKMREDTEERMMKMMGLGLVDLDRIEEEVCVALRWGVPDTEVLGQAMDALAYEQLRLSVTSLFRAMKHAKRNARSQTMDRLDSGVDVRSDCNSGENNARAQERSSN